MTTETLPTRLPEYIKEILPWAHGHQLKAITAFVAAILAKQTGCQAELARTQGNQEAATKRLSRLRHNPRLRPKDFAEWLCQRVLEQWPSHGKVRLTIDWTSEGGQHLRVVSLVVGRRALPIFWRAYAQSVLKGRMKRYELAVVKRAFRRILHSVEPRRLWLTADRGFPEADLLAWLDPLEINYIIRVKGNVKVFYRGQWVKLNRLRFEKNARRRHRGQLPYGESDPRPLWMTMRRARHKKGKWETRYRVSHRGGRSGPPKNTVGAFLVKKDSEM